jgi:hypothetical protein
MIHSNTSEPVEGLKVPELNVISAVDGASDPSNLNPKVSALE